MSDPVSMRKNKRLNMSLKNSVEDRQVNSQLQRIVLRHRRRALGVHGVGQGPRAMKFLVCPKNWSLCVAKRKAHVGACLKKKLGKPVCHD